MDRLSQSQIPTVDISSFTSDSTSAEKQSTAKEFAEKCSQSGCLRITGHGIPLDMIQRAFATCEQLYDLPYADKMKAPHPPTPLPHRGYSGVGGEKTAPKYMYDTDAEDKKIVTNDEYVKGIDYKESFELGSEEDPEQPNIWLPEDVFPGFRAFTLQFYWKLAETSNAIVELIIAALGLKGAEASAIRDIHIHGHSNQLRLLHYLPISPSNRSDDEVRLKAHCDLNSFSLVLQKSQGGLEYLNRKTGEYMPTEAEEGSMYMNIADMIQRISNGRFPGGMHRVTIPSPDADGKVAARYSLVYFVSPSFHEKIAPPKSLVERDGGTCRYEPTTLSKYINAMFASTAPSAKELKA